MKYLKDLKVKNYRCGNSFFSLTLTLKANKLLKSDSQHVAFFNYVLVLVLKVVCSGFCMALLTPLTARSAHIERKLIG
ncbi:hypothetical protein VCHA39O220_30009 [Vibrio chagasii]|nr:hypothetical protein VCHA39O220_30009 [Vibrio chagasii]